MRVVETQPFPEAQETVTGVMSDTEEQRTGGSVLNSENRTDSFWKSWNESMELLLRAIVSTAIDPCNNTL